MKPRSQQPPTHGSADSGGPAVELEPRAWAGVPAA